VKKILISAAAAALATAILFHLSVPPPAEAQRREYQQLARDVDALTVGFRDMQRSMDERHAVLKTLVEQSLDAINRLSLTMGALDRSVQDVQANTGARMDTLATQVQALADNLEEVKVRMGRLQQQMADTQSTLQSLDARVAGGAPIAAGDGATSPGAPAGGPPAPAEVLYSNALRDLNSGKYDLARQEFTDYLRYYPDTDLASNAQFYLGEIFYAERKYREAIGEYDKVLDNHPRSFKLADARFKKAMALVELGDRAGAVREFREVVRRHPGTEAERRARARLREMGATVSQ
jgi:tol-pal system protein YbgF